MLRAARGHAPVTSSRPSSQMPTALQFARAVQNIVAAAMLLCNSTAGVPPQNLNVCGACCHAAGGKLRAVPPTCVCTSPGSSQQQGRPPQAGRDTAVAPRLDPAPASQRPQVHGRLGPNYDARSIMHSWQLTHRSTDINPANGHQPKVEHEEAPPQAWCPTM
jgi:hypothetical protein